MSNEIDHVLTFADAATAHSVLDPLGFGGTNQGVPYWDISRCIPNTAVITANAVWNNSDPLHPVLTTPEVHYPGWHIAIALPSLSAQLTGLAGNVCRFVSDRGKGGTGPNCVIYLAPDIDPLLLTGSRISPVFAGSGYIFGI
jgi:hypothetical protein